MCDQGDESQSNHGRKVLKRLPRRPILPEVHRQEYQHADDESAAHVLLCSKLDDAGAGSRLAQEHVVVHQRDPCSGGLVCIRVFDLQLGQSSRCPLSMPDRETHCTQECSSYICHGEPTEQNRGERHSRLLEQEYRDGLGGDRIQEENEAEEEKKSTRYNTTDQIVEDLWNPATDIHGPPPGRTLSRAASA